MDKNTLSNYGWIVIAVLVLSVMIALATPFGSFIEQGVRATTEGLFDTSKNAVNSAFEDLGVQMEDQTFEEGYTGGQSTQVKTITLSVTGNPHSGNGYPTNYGMTVKLTANENQTWEEWVNSSYNTIGLKISPDGFVVSDYYGDSDYLERLYDNRGNYISSASIVATSNYAIECYYEPSDGSTEYDSISFSITFKDYSEYYMYGNPNDIKEETFVYTIENSFDTLLNWESFARKNQFNVPDFADIRFTMDGNSNIVCYDALDNLEFIIAPADELIENNSHYEISTADKILWQFEKK